MKQLNKLTLLLLIVATVLLTAVVLLLAGFLIGRTTGESDPPALRAPALAKVDAGTARSPLVMPAPISVPPRVSR